MQTLMRMTAALFLGVQIGACASPMERAKPGFAARLENEAAGQGQGREQLGPDQDAGQGEAARGQARPPRRAVPQRHLPAVPLSPPPAARPAPLPAPPSVRMPDTAKPRPTTPIPLTTCDAGGCWNGNAERYQGGGSTYLNRGGRLCQRQGAWMQCF